jgi:uncharacterized membrane protein YeaQ/YmgE (transglycosylase-associated protein family)
MMGVLSWLIVGGIAGWIAGVLVPGDERLGVVGHIVLGIVGAVVGGFIAGAIIGGEYVTGINVTTIVVATIGAIVVVVGWNLVTRRRAADRI